MDAMTPSSTSSTGHRRTPPGGRIWIGALLGGLLHASTWAAGFARVTVPAEGEQPPLQALIWTPCSQPPQPQVVGPFTLQGTPGCAVQGRDLPLVVISHGQGGSLLGHHDTATALADAGFVVAALNHPGDTYGDDGRAQQLSIFESRPRDVSRLVSFMTQRWPQREVLRPRAIGLFGFSRGGYTGLALVGARPNLQAASQRICQGLTRWLMPLCWRASASGAHIQPQVDPRIRAAVIVDPLNLFDAAGLAQVRVPVQLWASQQGGDGVKLPDVEAIRNALPPGTEYHVAQGAGHFAYLAPCPPALAADGPKLCRDPDGFDRVAWHRQMNAAVVRFFQARLNSPVL